MTTRKGEDPGRDQSSNLFSINFSEVAPLKLSGCKSVGIESLNVYAILMDGLRFGPLPSGFSIL